MAAGRDEVSIVLEKEEVAELEGEKLNAAKALIARSLVFIREADASVSDLELNQRNVATALRNTESIKKDRDHYKERAAWLQGAINESRNDLKPLTGWDKLKKDLEAVESNVAEFSKRFDLANQPRKLWPKI
ncbi:hypothetical protein Fot_21345 [Forsythia ovata]|uniref:Biogenesis of lysosome-related organelles complex 1 subunit 1 n=1 Tax=Forsythia ovata TaxID=205694 RepID=A0ABD1UUK6_9LAMI